MLKNKFLIIKLKIISDWSEMLNFKSILIINLLVLIILSTKINASDITCEVREFSKIYTELINSNFENNKIIYKFSKFSGCKN